MWHQTNHCLTGAAVPHPICDSPVCFRTPAAMDSMEEPGWRGATRLAWQMMLIRILYTGEGKLHGLVSRGWQLTCTLSCMRPSDGSESMSNIYGGH